MDDRPAKKDRKKKAKSRNDSPPPRGASPPPSLRPYTIPKTGSKELFASISLESRTGQEIIKNINNTLYDASVVNLEILKLELVQNCMLEAEYALKRKEMREKKYSSSETSDSYGFLIFRNIAECKKACSTGIERKNQYIPSDAGCCIGDKKYGIYLCRCADMLKRIPLWRSTVDCIMLVCKFMKGRLKSVQEQRSHSNASLEPTPEYDGHVSKNFQRGKKLQHDKIYNSSQVYLYEINLDNFTEEDDSAIFAKRPRQCLPYAIATFRATQKTTTTTQKQTIPKPKPLKPVQIASQNSIDRGLDALNRDLDFEELTQQRIKYLWSGLYFNNNTQLAGVQIGVYCSQNVILPIEGPHLCISQKRSIEKLSQMFPQKIFRKPPVLNGISTVVVDKVKFLHAEIHPLTVTSAKIEKLHAHWLKTNMAGICTLGSGLKLFIIPTGEFTDKIGITCPGYPPILHCLFMRQYLDSACVFDMNKEQYENFKKLTVSSLRDRLCHNEELKQHHCSKSVSTAKIHGYSTKERLRVLAALSGARKAFDHNRHKRAAPFSFQLTKENVFDTLDEAQTSNDPHDPRLSASDVHVSNKGGYTFPDIVASSQISSTSKDATTSTDTALTSTKTTTSIDCKDTDFQVTSISPEETAQPVSSSMTEVFISNLLNPKTSSTANSLNAPSKNPSHMDLKNLLLSPSVQLLKYSNPDLFNQLTNQNSKAINLTIDGASSEEHVIENKLSVRAEEDTGDCNKTSTPTDQHSSNKEIPNTKYTAEGPSTFIQPQQQQQPVKSVSLKAHESENAVRHNIYRKSTASFLMSLCNLSDETIKAEKDVQSQMRGYDRSLDTRDRRDHRGRDRRDSSRDRDVSRGWRKHRSKDRGRDRSKDRGRDRSKDRGRDRSKDRGRDRSKDRGKDRSKDRGRDRSNDRSRHRDSYRERSNDSRYSSRRYDENSRESDRNHQRPTENYASTDTSVLEETVAEKLRIQFSNIEQMYRNKIDERHEMAIKAAPLQVSNAKETNKPNITKERKEDYESGIPFLDTSQDENDSAVSEDQLVIDTDTQNSSANENPLQITKTRNVPIDRSKAERALENISAVYYEDSGSFTNTGINSNSQSNSGKDNQVNTSINQNILTGTSNTNSMAEASGYSSPNNLLSPVSALNALKDEMLKQANGIQTPSPRDKSTFNLDGSSESDFTNIEESINAQRRKAQDQRSNPSNIGNEINSNDEEQFFRATSKYQASLSSNASSQKESSTQKQCYESITSVTSPDHSSDYVTMPHSSHSNSDRSGRSRERNGSKSRDRSRDRQMRENRWNSASSYRHDSPSGSRRCERREDSPRKNRTPKELDGRSPAKKSSILAKKSSTTQARKKTPAIEKTKTTKLTSPNGLTSIGSSTTSSSTHSAKHTKTNERLPKYTTIDTRLPKQTSTDTRSAWKEQAMRRTEERRRTYSSSSSEAEKKVQSKELKRKSPNQASKKESHEISWSDNSEILDGDEKEKKGTDTNERERIMRERLKELLSAYASSGEEVVDFRLRRKVNEKKKIVEPSLPKQKKNRQSSTTPKVMEKRNEKTDRSKTPPLEELLGGKEIEQQMLPTFSPPTRAFTTPSVPFTSQQFVTGLLPQVVPQVSSSDYSHPSLTSVIATLPSKTINVQTPPKRVGEKNRDFPLNLSPVSSESFEEAFSSESCVKATSLEEWDSKLPRSELDDFRLRLISDVTKELE